MTLEVLPIFPLPDMVLFPRTHIRLHVFEPRYLAMMDYVMANGQHLGLAHLRPGYERDYYGTPPIYKMLTSARILVADKMPDGRWNMVVEGVQRARLVDEVQSAPFRMMRIAPLVEEVDREQHRDTMRLMESAARKADAIAEHFVNGKRNLTNLINIHMHPSVVADVIAAHTVADAYTRQSLLEEVDSHRRLRLLLVHLDEVIEQLKHQGVELNLPAIEAE